jgi:phage tail-like protein
VTDVTDADQPPDRTPRPGGALVPAARPAPDSAVVPVQVARREPADLPTPFPLAAMLPAVYQSDPFTVQLCAALDRVLAPVLAILDALPAYLDPATTPPAMVSWLGSWVGLALDAAWPEERRRALVGAAAQLHAQRGTRRGLEEAVRLATGAAPDVAESGSAVFALDPLVAAPGSDRPFLRITVREQDLGGAGDAPLRSLLALLVPAHVPWELVVS